MGTIIVIVVVVIFVALIIIGAVFGKKDDLSKYACRHCGGDVVQGTTHWALVCKTCGGVSKKPK